MRCSIQKLVSATLTAVALAAVLSCASSTRYSPSPVSNVLSGEMEVLAIIQPDVDALIAEYRTGNFSGARESLQLIFRALESIALHSYSEKIAFLEYYFPQPHSSPQLGTIIEEILAQTGPMALSPGGTEGPSPPDEAIVLRGFPPGVTRDYFPTPTPNNFRGDLHTFIAEEIRKIAVHMGEGENFHLPRDFLEEIENYVRLFQTDAHYRPLFQKAIRRSRKYIPALRRYFLEKGFPEEIMYLGLIESGFNPVARSHSGAVGMFQFIKSTARKYGLRVNRAVDERYSPIKSARACRNYLHDLWMELGSFTLALSAYNSGAGKVREALRRLNNPQRRDFWTIREKTRVLREETRNFVPKIFAAIVIAKPGNAKKFGFYDPPFPDPETYRMVIVPHSVSLTALAKAAGISVRDILRLNPDLEPEATTTPRRVLDYPLFVPKGTEKKIAAAVKRLARRRRRNTTRAATRSGSRTSGNTVTIAYRVQKGNTLSHISAWFGKSIAQLKRWNPYLRRRSLRAGDVVYVRDLPSGWAKITHTVKRGETLSGIAGRYRVSVRALKAWNGLRGETLLPGTRLTIYTCHPQGIHLARAPSISALHSSSPSTLRNTRGVMDAQRIGKGERFTYAVARGNTLSDIARLFGVSVAQLRRWNRLRSSRIRVGQRLKVIAGKPMRFYKYRVQKGDTLSKLAARFHTTGAIIRTVNGKRSSLLRAGEVLRIYGF